MALYSATFVLLIGSIIPMTLCAEVFLEKQDAGQVLSRLRRANSAFEELRAANLERECNEERCSIEEAMEIFKNKELANDFWNTYVDGNQCDPNQCLNNGICKDGVKMYTCICPNGFEGNNCELTKIGCVFRNGGCNHFCLDQENKAPVCTCVKGYRLQDDGHTCEPVEAFPCGRLHPEEIRAKREENRRDEFSTSHSDENLKTQPHNTSSIKEQREDVKSIAGGMDCPRGDCPWQALVKLENNLYCGGTILNLEWILTAAHCVPLKPWNVVVGEHNLRVTESSEQHVPIKNIVVHSRYDPITFDNDLALLQLERPLNFSRLVLPACLPERDFADKVLVEEQSRISGWGSLHHRGIKATVLQIAEVPFVDTLRCKESSSSLVTKNMFCAGYSDGTKDACQHDSGGPHVTIFKDTWFATGIISWGEGCARKGKYGVYTRVSRYLLWMHQVMQRASIYQLEIPTRGIRFTRNPLA
ncbi:unnamed protein product [Lampetra planeri]